MSIEGKPKVSEMEQAVFTPFAKTKGVNKIWVRKENEHLLAGSGKGFCH
jgi:hypothetical protein